MRQFLVPGGVEIQRQGAKLSARDAKMGRFGAGDGRDLAADGAAEREAAQAQRDPAFARTEIFRSNDVSRPPESAVAAPALPAQSKIVKPKPPSCAVFRLYLVISQTSFGKRAGFDDLS